LPARAISAALRSVPSAKRMKSRPGPSTQTVTRPRPVPMPPEASGCGSGDRRHRFHDRFGDRLWLRDHDHREPRPSRWPGAEVATWPGDTIVASTRWTGEGQAWHRLRAPHGDPADMLTREGRLG
jgi:hypothetical protein